MFIILVKTNNRSWSVNMSGPFKIKKDAVEAVKALDKKLNGKGPVKVYQFHITYVDEAEADQDLVPLDY